MGKGGGKGSAGLMLAPGQAVSLDKCHSVGLGDGITLPLKRSHNFCAGPAMLDSAAMVSMWTDFLSWQDSGVSLIEMSQRDVGGPVQTMIASAADNLRTLLDIPSNYRILLFQGGAHGQFAAVPMNLCGEVKHAQYIDGGFWSDRARSEACKLGFDVSTAGAVYRCPRTGKLRYPDVSKWDIDPTSAFLHIVSNETIQGVELGDPDIPGCVIAADMTSTLLSRPVDVSRYGVIYASGGKNLGPAGVCVVIVREDLLDCAVSNVPSILDWRNMDNHNNLYNTQCTFAIWAMKTVTDQLLAQGGLLKVEKRVAQNAHRLYEALDNSEGFYCNDVASEYRSRTSVPFRIAGGDGALERAFILEAEAAGLYQLAGHHSIGGLRVCIYNGLPNEALDCLLDFMDAFRIRHTHR